MSKLRQHKKLVLHWQAGRRHAFSLAELIISIAILLLMLSLAGQVFNLTVKSTGQATALTRVDQDFRVLEQTLRDDLRHVQPGQSVMVIQGNPVNAYWSRNGKEADSDADPSNGYPHNADPERDHIDPQGNHIPVPPRADMLMFFTAHPGSSYLNPSVSSNVEQIVYGHAETGEFTAAAGAPGTNPSCDTAYSFNLPPVIPPPAPSLRVIPTSTQGNVDYPDPKAISGVPAEQWHLARRAVLLQAGDIPQPPPVLGLNYGPPKNAAIDDPQLLSGSSDTLWNFNFVDEVLKLTSPPTSGLNASPLFLPRVFTHGGTQRFPYARSQLSLAPPALCADHLGSYFLPNCASFKVEWSLNPHSEFIAGRFDGIGETLWFDEGDIGDETSGNDPPSPLRTLKNKIESLRVIAQTDPNAVSSYHAAFSVLCCPGPQNCDKWGYGGFRIDGMQYSLAQQFDPKVAKAYCQGPPDPDFSAIWPDPGRPNLAEFNATRPVLDPSTGTPTGAYVPDDVFPGALRITVDLYDPERRLDKPIRHVMVIPIGE